MLWHKVIGAGGIGGAAIVEGAFDFSTANTTAIASFDYASALAQSSANNDKFSMSYDGTKMFVVLNNNNTMYGFDLSTAWDLSTASYSGENFNVGSRTQGAWKPDGTSFFYTRNDSNIYQRNASTPWDCSTFGSAITQSTALSNLRGFGISTDGTKGIVFSNNTNLIYEVDFSTAWDVTTATIDTGGNTISETGNPDEGLNTSIDGLMVYMHEGTTISQYALATAWDLSSATETNTTYSSANGRCCWSSTDGVYGYALDSDANGYIRQFEQ